MLLGKLEQLKFKMEMQTKNLKLFQNHQSVMSGVYQEERGLSAPQDLYPSIAQN